MLNLLKSKKGFTLVELMVVVVILGILVAIAVPVFNNATGAAEEAACEANEKMIVTAIEVALASGTARDSIDSLTGLVNEVPTCPVDGSAYSVTDGVLTLHNH